MLRFLSALAVALAAATAVVVAQDHAHPAANASAGEVAAAYAAAAAAMHEGMAIEPTGDADVDFARGMIPHHEGAIAMAEVLLAHGTDPTLREMATEIIRAQQAEIAVLEDWLAARGETP
jgi:uncharacterized protein (DUF305 family)